MTDLEKELEGKRMFLCRVHLPVLKPTEFCFSCRELHWKEELFSVFEADDLASLCEEQARIAERKIKKYEQLIKAVGEDVNKGIQSHEDFSFKWNEYQKMISEAEGFRDANLALAKALREASK